MAGDVLFTAETDRIYFDTSGPITIADNSLGRRIRIDAEHARTAVVWNPWVAKARALADLGDLDWQRFVCVETCNVAAFAVALGPGESHVMRARVSVL